MRVLVTGNRGFVGTCLERSLARRGIEVTGYDIKDGLDIRDYRRLEAEARGCDAIVHLAAVDNNDAAEIADANIVGMVNVLDVFRGSGARKLINMSRVDSLGVFQGEGKPRYLPLDDGYPCHPARPYSLSKLAGEKLCEHYHGLCGKPILCVRAPGIWDEDTYGAIIAARRERPDYEWDPYWEYGAFVDVRDLVEAIYLGLVRDFTGYHCCLASSDDITTSGRTSRELVDFVHPGIQWKGDDAYMRYPFRTLVDNGRLKELLGWRPEHSWAEETAPRSRMR
jgi:nucleoside-diphosphate-sugar epimerase